ncbi:MAG: aldehyde oxidase [Gemmatimonadota bacterium]|nr:MAG: aldehyde oxidase [Gemmatimonadota bacterium]
MAERAIGTDVPRIEGIEKLTGEAVYVDDLPTEGVWFGATVRSDVPRGRIASIDRNPAFPWDEVVVVTAADIPGRNVIPLLKEDQPALAAREIHHAEEPVALVAAPSRELAARAAAALTVQVEPLPATLDAEAALAAGAEVFKRIEIRKGDPDAADRADLIVEGTYRFGSQEHVYIEPQGMQAEWTEAGLVLRGSLQCPYYIVGSLGALLDEPEDRIRVIQMATGGGFGGKEEYPTLLAAHAALLSRAAGHPVRIVYDRAEDMRATTKRHPGRVTHRTGLTRDGRIVSMDVDVLLDAGAYCTLSPVVLSRGALHATGPYDVPNARVLARAVATNFPPHGAFRGFGAPQTIFALETHLEECAERVGLSGVEFRRRNLLRPGGTLATGQDLGQDIAAEAVLDRALKESGFEERRAAFDAFNAQAARREGAFRFQRRGIGLALFHHGAGFTGSGEVTLASRAGLAGLPDGTVLVLSAQTEIGQGTRTVLAQAAADGLGLPVDRIRSVDPDTAVAPNSGPTVASRTSMVIGGLLLRAGQEFRAKVEAAAGRALPTSDEFCAEIARQAGEGPLEHIVQYQAPPGIHWDEEHYRGDAYATYAWACYVAALEVDTLTGETQVLDFTAVQEVGRVLNPVLASGQIEGGVTQGIGWALLENVQWEKGRMRNATMTDYIVPTFPDTPPIRVHFLEHPHDRAPHGAKGIGELPMDGPAPAIANALRHALGIHVREIPATAERVLSALEAGRAGSAPTPESRP